MHRESQSFERTVLSCPACSYHIARGPLWSWHKERVCHLFWQRIKHQGSSYNRKYTASVTSSVTAVDGRWNVIKYPCSLIAFCRAPAADPCWDFWVVLFKRRLNSIRSHQNVVYIYAHVSCEYWALKHVWIEQHWWAPRATVIPPENGFHTSWRPAFCKWSVSSGKKEPDKNVQNNRITHSSSSCVV